MRCTTLVGLSARLSPRRSCGRGTDLAHTRRSGSLMRFESPPPATALISSPRPFARKVKARARQILKPTGLGDGMHSLEGRLRHSYPIFLTDRGRLVRRNRVRTRRRAENKYEGEVCPPARDVLWSLLVTGWRSVGCMLVADAKAYVCASFIHRVCCR